jgi:hypothetical protein
MPAFVAPLAALPWLQGFFAPAAVTGPPSIDVGAELAEWREPDEACIATAYGGLALHAELLPELEGPEAVLATFTQGVFVLDGERHVVAQVPGFQCEGSADELVAIAAGDVAIGEPVVALAATAGGRAESITWLSLYRISDGGELQPIFIGEVEHHADGTTAAGLVTIVPGGLVYRDPAGRASTWIYDLALGRYVEQPASPPRV